MRKQRGHPQLGIAGQARQGWCQLSVKTVFAPNQALQFLAYLIAEGIRDQHTHFAFSGQSGLHETLEKVGLAHHRRGFPLLTVVYKALPAHVQMRQKIVGVQIFHLLAQCLQQRRLPRLARMEDKFAIALVQPEPALRVLFNTVGQRVHLQLRQIQRLHELRCMLDGLINMLIAVEPVPLSTLSHPLLHLLGADRARDDFAHQIAQNLTVDGLELIHRHQRSVRLSLQQFFDL